MTTGNVMWSDITDDALRILSEDARAIWNDLAHVHRLPTLDRFPPIDPALRTAIDDRRYKPIPAGVVGGAGPFDATRPDRIRTLRTASTSRSGASSLLVDLLFHAPAGQRRGSASASRNEGQTEG